jgi:hypothetical protein
MKPSPASAGRSASGSSRRKWAFALALGWPGGALMGLVGSVFVGGAFALGFLLLAEWSPPPPRCPRPRWSTPPRHRNLMISALMIVMQILLTIGYPAAAGISDRGCEPARALPDRGHRLRADAGAGLASILKARLLQRLLGRPVHGWRWSLIWAAGAATLVGVGVTFLPAWAQLIAGIPLILGVFGLVVWKRGFTAEDRVLFRFRKGEEPSLPDLAH